MAAMGTRLANRLGGWTSGLRRQWLLVRGRRALASSRLFDPQWYRLAHQIASDADPLGHYLSGPLDRRPSPWFDAAWYLGRNPDVGLSGLHPLAHYILFGAREGRNPNAHFATRWYLESHPDAARHPTPLDHYVSLGAARLADPAPDFDAAWYRANNMDEDERGLDPLAHYLLVGRGLGVRTQAFCAARAGEPIEVARLETFKPLEPARGQVVALITATAVEGRLSAEARGFVETLAGLGVRTVLVVEADAPFAPSAGLLNLLAGGYVREPRGHRYAAWAHLIRAEPLLFSGEMLLLINGDMASAAGGAAFKPFLRRLRASAADLQGVMTQGRAGKRLDSDLIAFQRGALGAATLSFFGGLRSSEDDERAVRIDFETQLTAMATASGLSVEVLPESPMHALREAASRPSFFAVPAAASQPPPRAAAGRLLAPGFAAEPTRPWKIAFVGPWNFATGLSQAGRGYLSALWRTGVRLNVHPIEAPFHVHRRVAPTVAARDFDGAADAVIIHLNPDAWGALTPVQRAIIDNARVRIGLWVWEMGHVPDSWLPAFDAVDEIWTPSRYCAEVLAAQTRKPVSVVPHVVPTPAPGAADRAAVLADLGVEPEARLILYAFDAASFIMRKNPQALIRAFAAANLAARGWRLVLKTKNLMERPQDGAALLELASGVPGVVLLEKQLDQEALSALFEAADIYASPHRSEGFGLTVAEAMAMGKPVVASDFGGVRDFLDASCGFPVPVEVVSNEQDSIVYPRGGRWAEVTVADFAAALGDCAAQVEAGDRRIGERARARIAERLSADVVAGVMMQTLERALATEPRSASAA